MTDRWKDALRELDEVGPDDSVYRRAAQGPTRSDLPPSPNRSSRIVAGVTAFAVFALAAVFAWQAFRPVQRREGPSPSTEVVEPGAEGSLLWPIRTTQMLEAEQSAADSGDGVPPFLLDAHRLIEAFADRVLGWRSGSYDVSTQSRDDGSVAAILTRRAVPCPSPSPGGAMDVACYTGSEEVVVAQPGTTGDGGLWVVMSVSSPDLTIEGVPGEVVTNGTSIPVTSTLPVGLRTVTGSLIGSVEDGRDCDLTSGVGRVGHGAGTVQVQVAPDADAGTTCGPDAPGFVWVASAMWDIHPGADPLVGDSTTYTAVSAIPILVSIPENATSQGVESYVDPLGWRVDYPAGWTMTAIDTQVRVSMTGAAFSNVSPGVASPTSATPSPVGLDPNTMPSEAVEVVITHREGGPAPDLTTDDTRFPVTLDGLGCPLADMLLCGVSVRGGGLDFSIEVRRGPDASPEDIAAAEALVASMRFRAFRLGEQAHGWASLGRPALYPQGEGTPAWVGGRLGVVYVMRGPRGTYALDLNPDACGEGENETWDPKTLQIWIQCPAYLGTGDMRYDRFGDPDPNNGPKFQTPLEAHPVITAWDGSLLVYMDGSMDGLPQASWP